MQTFDFLQQNQGLFVNRDGQKGTVNTRQKRRRKNRILIEPVAAISQKNKLQLKAGVSDDRVDYFVSLSLTNI